MKRIGLVALLALFFPADLAPGSSSFKPYTPSFTDTELYDHRTSCGTTVDQDTLERLKIRFMMDYTNFQQKSPTFVDALSPQFDGPRSKEFWHDFFLNDTKSYLERDNLAARGFCSVLGDRSNDLFFKGVRERGFTFLPFDVGIYIPGPLWHPAVGSLSAVYRKESGKAGEWGIVSFDFGFDYPTREVPQSELYVQGK